MMIRLLFIAAATVGLTEQAFVFSNCDCTPQEVFSIVSVTYCPTSSYTTCNASLLVEDSCTISCSGSRTQFVHKNGSSLGWTLGTKSIKCEDGSLFNDLGKKIVNTAAYPLKPTCGIKNACDKCPMAFESTFCPANFTCNPVNFKRYIDTDGCDRVTCDNAAVLTLYDDQKNVVTYSSPKLYCAVNNKWYNYSLDGGISGGVAVSVNVTANCILPLACEKCSNPLFVTNLTTQVPVQFRTGYRTATPTITRQAGQCATAKCPNAYILMGFMNGVNVSQTGVEQISNQYMKCGAEGFWRNGDTSAINSNLYTICMQKITVCPPVDNVLMNSGIYTIACNEQTKLSTLTCPAGTRVYMRYNTPDWTTTKYDRATFFEGKGWLAHGCDAVSDLYTTSGGQQIWVTCS